jgi:hypothetical protein
MSFFNLNRSHGGDISLHEHAGFSIRFVKNELIGLADTIGKDRFRSIDVDNLPLKVDVNLPKGDHGRAKHRKCDNNDPFFHGVHICFIFISRIVSAMETPGLLRRIGGPRDLFL